MTDAPDLNAATLQWPATPAFEAALAPGALAAALLAAADAVGSLVAVKEIASGRYVHLNARMAAWLGGPAASPAALLGSTDEQLLGAAGAGLQPAEQAAAGAGAAHTSEHCIERNAERRVFTVVRHALAPAAGGAPRWLLSVWNETTRERQAEAQLECALAQIEAQQLAGSTDWQRAAAPQSNFRDTVTGLYGSAHFDDQLRREVDLSSREHREFALVAVVLDAQKGAAGAPDAPARTRVLEALGRLLASNTRAMDGACRMGDDRFAILLSGVGLATAHSRMEQLRRQCATQIVMYEGRTLGFTVSMGVASFPHTAQTQPELLDAADSALQEARRRGGNHVALASIRFEAS